MRLGLRRQCRRLFRRSCLCDVDDKGMADAVGEDGVLGAAEEELVAGAEDDTVTATISDGQNLCCSEVRGFDNIDLATRVDVTFWDRDVDEAICGVPDWLLDAICCIVERDFMNDFAVCDGDKGEYGDIVIGACDYCQFVVRVVSHLVCAFGDAKRNSVDDGYCCSSRQS